MAPQSEAQLPPELATAHHWRSKMPIFGGRENAKNGEVHQTRPGSRRLGFPTLSRGTRKENIRQRIQRSLAAMAGAPKDADERESPQSGRCHSAQIPGGADGQTFLRQRRRGGGGIRASIQQMIGTTASPTVGNALVNRVRLRGQGFISF